MKSINALFLLMFIGLAVGLAILYTKLPKVAYIEPAELYQDYVGKAYYDSIYNEQVGYYQDTLDIISSHVQAVYEAVEETDTASINKFKRAQQYFYDQTGRFQKLETQIREHYVSQIWKALNEQIKEYGLENGYDYIYGANGTGNVMYAKDGHNITQDVKAFINLNYRHKEAEDSTNSL